MGLVTKRVYQPHDKFFHAAMNNPRVAKAFFEHHLPATVLPLVNLDKLQACKDTYVDEQLQMVVTDMLFTAPFGDTLGYLYILAEHQTQAEPLMAYRLLKYIIAIIDQHLTTYGGQRLPIIYPLVFYTGEGRYPHSTDIFDLFDGPKGLARETFLKPFQLVDVHRIPDEKLKEHVWSSLLELCMKHVVARDILPFFQSVISSFQTIERSGGKSYVQAALKYLLAAGEVEDKEAFFDTVRTHLSPEAGETIMSIAQQIRTESEARGEARGVEKGILQGRQEGRQEGEGAMLLRLLQLKFKTVPENYQQKIAQADADTLLKWAERVLSASTIDEVFADSH
jgi:predicted transposase/invertase (TIGR01784 family)